MKNNIGYLYKLGSLRLCELLVLWNQQNESCFFLDTEPDDECIGVHIDMCIFL